MTYIRTYPKQIYNNDVSFFDGGFRLSHNFIATEKLQDYKSIIIYVDEARKRLGLSFYPEMQQQAVTLTKSSKNTIGKTVWCAYLKEYSFIKWIMEDPEIRNRRFSLEVSNIDIPNGEKIDYEIDVSNYDPTPF